MSVEDKMKRAIPSQMVLFAALVLTACEKGPTSASPPPIELWAELRGTSVHLWWVVHDEPTLVDWSCDLYSAPADADDWSSRGEFFPSDEFDCWVGPLDELSNHKFQVRIFTLFERISSNIVFCSIGLNRPEGLAAQRSDGTMTLTWADRSAVEDAYELQRVSSREDNFRTVAQLPANTTQYNDSGLDSGTSYTYRVRARRGAITSDWSDSAGG
jgi:hypothetical protein